MINDWSVVGRLGKDPESKTFANGAVVYSFPVATDRNFKDKKTNEWKRETDWVSVTVWNKEWIGEHLHKGDLVSVQGRGQTRNYDDKNGVKHYATELVADHVINLSSAVKGRGEKQPDNDMPWQQ